MTGSALAAPRTIGSVWETIGPPVPWDRSLAWPPDVFALMDRLLVQADAYRFVSSPPAGAAWPPYEGWTGSVRAEGKEWSEAVRLGTAPGPGMLLDRWEILTKAREVPLDLLSRGDPWNVCEAVITLHALADEACSFLTALDGSEGSAFADQAWAMLEREGSLARFPPSGVRVLPKTHVPAGGITVRSLARYLSAHTNPVDVTWRRCLFPAISPTTTAEMTYRILLLPWPLAVSPGDFRPVVGPLQAQGGEFGFFRFEPQAPLDLDYVRGGLEAAQREGGAAIVILPESSVAEREIPLLEQTVSDFGVTALVAGARGDVDPVTRLGRNYAHIAIWTGAGWIRYEQEKHHRWLLDEHQIRQYQLEQALDPSRRWWEAIEVPPHRLEIVDGTGARIGSIDGENWMSWDFAIHDGTGAEVGRITKEWAGILKEGYTTADTYVLQIEADVAHDLRLLMFASAAGLDVALKQDDTGGWGFGGVGLGPDRQLPGGTWRRGIRWSEDSRRSRLSVCFRVP